ncbi:MAG: pilus assembly protein PilM [bacterium]|nr:pilus assembly protein PilM [bacterium]MDZ4284307.1 pilus assembly protein PilM [Patescibacteria group bacterium]
MTFGDLLRTLMKVVRRPVFGTRGPSVLGIDFGTSSLKVVQAYKQGGKAMLETYGAVALGPYGGVEVGQATRLSPEQAAAALTDLFREANVTTRQCAVAIPLSASLVSFMQLPEVSENELTTMVPLEARKYIPVPLSEVSLDWMIVPEVPAAGDRAGGVQEGGAFGDSDAHTPRSASGGAREAERRSAERVGVLVVAIHNEELALYRAIGRAAALAVHFVEVEIFSAVRAVLRQGMEVVLVVDVGGHTTKMYLVERGIVKGTHSINRGSQHITEALARSLGIPLTEAEELKRSGKIAEKMGARTLEELVPTQVDLIFAEIRRLLIQYQHRSLRVVSHAIFIGGGALLPGFLDRARAVLPTEVSLGDPFQKLEAPAFLEDVLRQAGPEFAVATGLALRALAEQ